MCRHEGPSKGGEKEIAYFSRHDYANTNLVRLPNANHTATLRVDKDSVKVCHNEYNHTHKRASKIQIAACLSNDLFLSPALVL